MHVPHKTKFLQFIRFWDLTASKIGHKEAKINENKLKTQIYNTI